ncbi:hypothetical protein H4R24_003242 [Coemansia sp. RSA 988]|nr:hypothetical protein H4R24_003242 [Coemansia sp. RSA 988]
MVGNNDSDPTDANGMSSGSKSEATPSESALTAPHATPKKIPAKCQACTICRQKKVRCDGGKPACTACIKSGSDCLYVPSRRRGRPARTNRGYERPYTNPLPILPRQPRSATASADAGPSAIRHDRQNNPQQQQPPHRILPTLPHLQPAQAGQGTMPPPPPQPAEPIRGPTLTNPLPPILPPAAPSQSLRQKQQQQQSTSYQPGSLHQRLQSNPQQQQQSQQAIAPLGNILSAALFPGSPTSTSEDDGGQSGHRSSGSESPLPLNLRPPPFLVPAGDRGGHQSMTQATPLVIPRSRQLLSTQAGNGGGSYSSSSYMDPNIIDFFHYFNAMFPIVHWPSFKEAYDDGTVPNYLILAIRALSKRYSKQPSVLLSGQPYAAGQDLAAIATSLAEVATREDPNTYLIQTWIVLSMFEFGMGRIKQAADRRELAVRLAYQLELSHIEVRASQRRARSLIVAENCRRVWWTLFYADRYFSLASSDSDIIPAIHESTYRVGFPRAMREATPSPPQHMSLDATGNSSSDMELSRYNDHDVILWFQSAIPLSLVMGHVAHQCRAAEQLFRGGLAERSTDCLWEDSEWLAALTEFMKSFLVIDAEILQWRQQLNAATSMSLISTSTAEALQSGLSSETLGGTSINSGSNAHSTRDVTLFHRELQYQALVIIHQCLALYAYEKLRLSLSALASACTSLLWLESTATQAWKKVVRSADIIRTKAYARATLLSNARSSTSGTMSNGTAPEPEWELCAPHMPFILYLSAKVHVCQYHWQKIALARTRTELGNSGSMRSPAGSREHNRQNSANMESHIMPSFVQPFSQPSSVVGTPAPAHDAWTTGSGGGNAARTSGRPDQANAPHNLSSLNADVQSRGSAATPIMTTSGAAALAAAQAAASAAAQSNSSRNTTPQRSRGGSIAAPRTPSGHERYPQSTDAAGEYSTDQMDVVQVSHGENQTLRQDRYGEHDTARMALDTADEPMAGDGDIESRLVHRVNNSQERIESLLRLLATCQEYWADHDYVRMLRDLLDWPDEWTTSMQMLERLLLELNID